MKIINILMRCFFIGLVWSLLSCEGQQNFLKVIPDNANLVSIINMAEVVDKFDITKTKLTPLLDLSHEEYSDNMKSLSVLIETPENTGLDFNAPLCVFRTSAVYLVAKINDVNALKSFFATMKQDGVASSVRESGGLYNTLLFDACEIYFDDATLLLCISSDEYGNVPSSKNIKRLFQLDEEEMFIYSDKYKEVTSKAGNADVATYHSHYLSEGKIELLSSLNLEANRFVLNTCVFNADKRINRMLDEIDKHTCLLKGRFAGIYENLPFLCGCVGVDGEWMIEFLKSNQELRSLLLVLERGIDIEKMVRSVNGDLAFVISDFTKLNSGKIPDITVIADVKNTDFLNDVDYWASSMDNYGMKMHKIAENQYILTFEDMLLNWGVTPENELFFSTSPSFSAANIHKQTNVHAPYKVQGNKLFMYTNLEETVKAGSMYAEIDMFCSLLGIGEPQYLLVKSNSAREFIVELGMHEK